MILHSHDERRATFEGNVPSTTPARRPFWTPTRLILLALVAGLLTLWLSPARAYADVVPHGTSVKQQPYGGCDEAWRYPRTRGAKQCRRAGWTITPHVTVNPHGVLRATDYQPCAQEDSPSCLWIGNRDGNRVGLNYWNDAKARSHYVWYVIPRGFHSLSARTARGMVKGHGHTTRYWMRCADRITNSTVTFRCANGWSRTVQA